MFSDTSFADCKGSKTTSGFIIRLYGDIVAWKAYKQHFVLFNTMSEACQETVSLLNSLKLFIRKDFNPVELYCDNRAAESSKMINVSNKLKHMTEVREGYVKECMSRNFVNVRWVPSKEKFADIFTKALLLETHRRLTCRILNLDEDKL